MPTYKIDSTFDVYSSFDNPRCNFNIFVDSDEAIQKPSPRKILNMETEESEYEKFIIATFKNRPSLRNIRRAYGAINLNQNISNE